MIFDHLAKILVELRDQFVRVAGFRHGREPADVAEQNRDGFFLSAQRFLERPLVLEHRLGDIFGNVASEDVAVAQTLDLLQRILKNDAERSR